MGCFFFNLLSLQIEVAKGQVTKSTSAVKSPVNDHSKTDPEKSNSSGGKEIDTHNTQSNGPLSKASQNKPILN